MSKLASYAGVPVEWVFGEKTLKFKPFSVRDLFTTQGWARNKCMSESRDFVLSLPAEERGTFIQDMVRYGVDEFTINQRVNSTEGIVYILWLSASKCDVKLTLDNFQDLVGMGSDTNLGDLFAILSGDEKPEEAIVPPVGPPVEQPSEEQPAG